MNRRIAGWAVAATLAILGGTTACSSEPTQVSVSAGASAATAPAAGAELDAEAFAAALKRAGTIVLDVRTPAEFAAGHLPGAVNIDVEAPDFGTRIAALDASLPYAVYCRSGNRSGVALAAMAAAGFTSAYHLGGGIGAWQAAGGEVVSGA
ncbi:MAG TPA: rhodanese-like domain-containing protein [Tetrasphaera sp.]|jgi:rhodanese-related sulfurtransferase|nr:rhodanese-like domain-containing protein [Tetrasphaera sp.]